MNTTTQSAAPSAGSVATTAFEPTQNLNVAGTHLILSPRQLDAEFPITASANSTVIVGRETIRQILRGDDPRLLVVVGPCSVHDVAAAREYADRVYDLAGEVADQFYVVMRVYFEKPRTTVGWKGLINDPHLDGTFDMDTGLRRARELLLHINALGLPCATELLDPIVPQYIDDLIAWAAIGARTTESQTHRQMASGLSMPVGYKNSTDGSVQVAIDAFNAARSAHHFLGVNEDGQTCVVKTRGNRDGHIILRGGSGRPNYDPANVTEAARKLTAVGLPPRLMVDCSHANSSKKHENQSAVWESIVAQRQTDACPVIGVMIESNLVAGRQDVVPEMTYGQSITDACLGWDDTRALLLDGARELRKR